MLEYLEKKSKLPQMVQINRKESTQLETMLSKLPGEKELQEFFVLAKGRLSQKKKISL